MRDYLIFVARAALTAFFAVLIFLSLCAKEGKAMTLSFENVEVIKREEAGAIKLQNVTARDTAFTLGDSAAFKVVCESNTNFHSIGFDIAWDDTSVGWGGVLAWGDVFPNYPQTVQLNVWEGYVTVLWYTPEGASPITKGIKEVLSFIVLAKEVEGKILLFFKPLW